MVFSSLKMSYIKKWNYYYYTLYILVLFRRRYPCIKYKTARYGRSFVLVAIIVLNKWYWYQQISVFYGYTLNLICILWQSFFAYIFLDAIMSCTKDILLSTLSELIWIELFQNMASILLHTNEKAEAALNAKPEGTTAYSAVSASTSCWASSKMEDCVVRECLFLPAIDDRTGQT